MDKEKRKQILIKKVVPKSANIKAPEVKLPLDKTKRKGVSPITFEAEDGKRYTSEAAVKAANIRHRRAVQKASGGDTTIKYGTPEARDLVERRKKIYK